MCIRDSTLSEIALKVLNFLLGMAGILTLIMLVVGGIVYLTSAGDEERIEWGKKTFTYSVIGIIIVLSAMVIVRQVAVFFAGSSSSAAQTSVTQGVDPSGL
jgi:heme O synthase-like polyprenyltransferase